MNRFRIYLVLLLLAAASFACQVELVTPTPTPAASTESNLSTHTAVASEDPVQVLTDEDESQQSPIHEIVTVTHGIVNLRNLDHASSGTFVEAGEVLAVECQPDGY